MAGIAASSMATAAAKANDIEDLRWQYRPLIVSAPGGDTEDLARQRTILSGESDGLEERDMAVIVLDGATVQSWLGPSVLATADAVRAQLGLPKDRFSVVLVGKDGGIKLRSADPVAVEQIFALIEGMPMRRREMRERASE